MMFEQQPSQKRKKPRNWMAKSEKEEEFWTFENYGFVLLTSYRDQIVCLRKTLDSKKGWFDDKLLSRESFMENCAKTRPQMISIYIQQAITWNYRTCGNKTNKTRVIYGKYLMRLPEERRSCDHKHTCARFNVFISWVREKYCLTIYLNKYIRNILFLRPLNFFTYPLRLLNNCRLKKQRKIRESKRELWCEREWSHTKK